MFLFEILILILILILIRIARRSRFTVSRFTVRRFTVRRFTFPPVTERTNQGNLKVPPKMQ
jgi:hypothetical protein